MPYVSKKGPQLYAPKWPFRINWDHPLTKDLVGFFPLIDGQAHDIVSGMVMTRTTGGHRGGPFGLSWDFNGTTHKLLNGRALITSLPLSIGAWATTDTHSGEREIAGLSLSTDSDPLCRIGQRNGGAVFAQFRDNGPNLRQAIGSTDVPTDAWAHVGGTFSDAGVECFMDGASMADDFGSTGSGLDVDQTEIGVLERNNDGQFWNGGIVFVGYWKRVLSERDWFELWAPQTRFDIVEPIVGRTYFFSGGAAGNDQISGSTAVTFTPTGSLSATGTLAGSDNVSFTPTGDVLGRGGIAVTASVTFSETADLSATGRLRASGTLTFGSSAAIRADAHIVASTTLTFSQFADLTDAASAPLTGQQLVRILRARRR